MKTTLSKGKLSRLLKLSNTNGYIAATAIDQRGSLSKSLSKALGKEASHEQVTEFKQLVSEELTPYSTAILLDPEFGWPAAEARDRNCGLLLAYEETGYDAMQMGRLPDLLPQSSALRYVEQGVDAVKILMYYDPDDLEEINDIKHAFIERVGAECDSVDIPFFFEAVTYSDKLPDAGSAEFARVKPNKVKKYMQEFSKPRYKIDVLKVEVPVNMKYVAGTAANTGYEQEAVYTREEALQHFRDTGAISPIPFIYLSAGVTNEVFLETLQFAGEAKVPFSGVLCGRATWQDGIDIYGKLGAKELRKWLQEEGKQRMVKLDSILQQVTTPWWQYYGNQNAMN
ncbi:tagatose-bisphosphate aldolase [Paenibacillus sp. IHB B 3415]|uniref:tagatose 1,6-diphosphate aldolase n=1 Tax=Paenibacillus sp. IHB B 3415 TaxID=867080 RepID=UPI0005736735|nr:tagatose 1,6-diphosphate aldolase [Paenibacillus sp. IHB B 3415]KHL97112.1 tagatose-bisphosphate aldolase [Paenibacillus sp. IHB B 3415]